MFLLCLGPRRVCWVLHHYGSYGGLAGPAGGKRGCVEAVLYGRQNLFHCIPCILPLILVVIRSLLDLWRLGGHLLEVYVVVDLLCCCEAASSFYPVGLRLYLKGYQTGLRGVREERAWLY